MSMHCTTVREVAGILAFVHFICRASWSKAFEDKGVEWLGAGTSGRRN